VAISPSPTNGTERSQEREGTSRAVVRRYRREPSPLVRDSVRGWRTGRLDRVLAGEFDVLS
jgi:ATP-dependent Clp protease ATP-binding subunit ClpC